MCDSCAKIDKLQELYDRFKPCELRLMSMSARENKPRCVFNLLVQFIFMFLLSDLGSLSASYWFSPWVL